jgi:hypothetical protein
MTVYAGNRSDGIAMHLDTWDSSSIIKTVYIFSHIHTPPVISEIVAQAAFG